jgi:hypothetical protein
MLRSYAEIDKLRPSSGALTVAGPLTPVGSASGMSFSPSSIHASPVVFTTPEEADVWLTAPVEEALKLQRPLQAGMLEIVARGEKKDAA